MRSPRPRGNRRGLSLLAVLLPVLAVLAVLPAFSGLVLTVALLNPGSARADAGVANGHVVIFDTPDSAYGFSAYTGHWTARGLDSPASARRGGLYLGLLRTNRQIYAFNCVNDRWFNRGFIGMPAGEDAEGAVAVAWTNRAIYGIATLWTLWRDQTLPPGANPIGGGSAGDFGLVWTTTMLYGYHAATHQWLAQPVSHPPIGGIADDGLGLVWTDEEAYAFDPSPGGWVALTLQEPRGISASGAGDVAVVWSAREAQAYSGPLDAWFPLASTEDLIGGSAGGEVALVWDAHTVHGFDANTGTWSSRTTHPPAPSGVPDAGGPDAGEPDAGGAGMRAAASFMAYPNPAPGGVVRMALPVDARWTFQVFATDGSLLRTQEIEGVAAAWDGCDEEGRAVAAGSYWIRAEAEGKVEAVRVVVVP